MHAPVDQRQTMPLSSLTHTTILIQDTQNVSYNLINVSVPFSLFFFQVLAITIWTMHSSIFDIIIVWDSASPNRSSNAQLQPSTILKHSLFWSLSRVCVMTGDTASDLRISQLKQVVCYVPCMFFLLCPTGVKGKALLGRRHIWKCDRLSGQRRC